MDTIKLGQILKWTAPFAFAVLLIVFFGPQVALALELIAGGGAVAFVVEPLTAWFARKMKRGTAVLLSVALSALVFLGLGVAFVPPIIAQLTELFAQLGRLVADMGRVVEWLNARLTGMGLNALDPGALDLSMLAGDAKGLVSGTASIAGGVAGAFMKIGLSVMLGVYFLFERDTLLMELELFIPSKIRKIVLRMGSESARGVRAYLRGQLTVSLIVSALASLGLFLVGVKSPLALGAIVGVLNMVPYFGPILGGVPAVLTALSQDLITALMTVAVLFIVQQIDGMLVSPRVMSGVTGLSPAAILLAMTIGGNGWGILGMLLALPVTLIVRICFRVWACRNEVIDNPSPV